MAVQKHIIGTAFSNNMGIMLLNRIINNRQH